MLKARAIDLPIPHVGQVYNEENSDDLSFISSDNASSSNLNDNWPKKNCVCFWNSIDVVW